MWRILKRCYGGRAGFASHSQTRYQEPPLVPAKLQLKSGQVFQGTSFGAPLHKPVSGEVVFTTSLVGYTESMTDPSYRGQLLLFTQPLIGNYGVPGKHESRLIQAPTLDEYGLYRDFESDRIQVQGILVSDYSMKYSHWKAVESLGHWCHRLNVPALTGLDTRAIVTLLREQGSTLGSITQGDTEPEFMDPNQMNLVQQVSVEKPRIYNPHAPLKIALLGK
jgi:carbamoyl-phosphate synthase small subunit